MDSKPRNVTGRARVNRVCLVCDQLIDADETAVEWANGWAHDYCAKAEDAYAEMHEDARDD